MGNEQGFFEVLRGLVGKTVSTVEEAWVEDSESEYNGFVVTCTDGTAVMVSIDYEDTDLRAAQLG